MRLRNQGIDLMDCLRFSETTQVLSRDSDVINELICRLQRELNITSVVVTHDIKSAYKVGNHIAMLHEGKIIYTAAPEDLRNTDHPIVRQFIEGRAEGPIKAV